MNHAVVSRLALLLGLTLSACATGDRASQAPEPEVAPEAPAGQGATQDNAAPAESGPASAAPMAQSAPVDAAEPESKKEDSAGPTVGRSESRKRAAPGRTQGMAAEALAAPSPAPMAMKPKQAGGAVKSTVSTSAVAPLAQAATPGDFQTESYDHVEEKGFVTPASQPLSTFSVDVDTASYSNVRRMLTSGQRPPAGAVRIEEMINYFDYGYPEPPKGSPFAVVSEVGQAPWATSHRLVHLGIQGKRIAQADLPPKNLVFLLDVSGSMEDENKLPLVRKAMHQLVDGMRPQDSVAIVVYAGASGLVLPPTTGENKASIRDALNRLQAGGSTNGGQGLQLAYATARQHLRPGAINRVILATDGDFNVGTTSQSDLVNLIEHERDAGVFLTVLGFGMGNYKDSTLEKLADRGNGNYAYVDNFAEAKKVLVEDVTGTLLTIAKDVKIQVEFNPQQVAAYRLIGYENRVMADRDFNDDKKDAGDIGAGHSVTALYEIIPVGVAVPGPGVDALKYQAVAATPAAASAELMTVKLRYKAPEGSTSQLMSFPVADSNRSAAQLSDDFRFSAAVAGFGMMLRGSELKGTDSWSLVRELARSARTDDPNGHRAEFLSLIDRAASMTGDERPVAIAQ
jgi:Ca-activated chloride channel family protein